MKGNSVMLSSNLGVCLSLIFMLCSWILDPGLSKLSPIIASAAVAVTLIADNFYTISSL